MTNKRKRAKSVAAAKAIADKTTIELFSYNPRKRPSLADRGRNSGDNTLGVQPELNYGGDQKFSNSSQVSTGNRTVRSYSETDHHEKQNTTVPALLPLDFPSFNTYGLGETNDRVRSQELNLTNSKPQSYCYSNMGASNLTTPAVEASGTSVSGRIKDIRKALPYDDTLVGQYEPQYPDDDDNHNNDQGPPVEDLQDDYYDSNDDEDPNKQYTSGPLDPYSGQRSAFPIGKLSILNSDLSTPPVNVADYLARVQKEANEIPAVTCVSKSCSNSKTVTSSHSNTTSHGFGYQETMKVDAKWYRQFVKATFPATRARLLLQSAAGKSSKCIVQKNLPQSLVDWRKYLITHTPSSLFLHALPHGVLLTLLQYACKWTTANMPLQLCSWIYGMLVALPDTLDGQEVSLLRRLAKKCILVQTKHEKLVVEVQCFLTFTVSVVSGIYAQSDLIELI